MEMVRQDHDCVDGKGTLASGDAKRSAQRVDVVDKRRGVTVGQCHGKKEGPAFEEVAAISNHMDICPRLSLRSSGLPAASKFGYPETAGWLNYGSARFGWGFSRSAGRNVLRLGIDSFHYDVPGIALRGESVWWRSGGLPGAVAGAATGLAFGCSCQ